MRLCLFFFFLLKIFMVFDQIPILIITFYEISGLSNLCPRFDADICGRFILHIILCAMHRDGCHLLQIVLLCSKAREKYQSGNKATRANVTKEKFQVQKRSQQNTKTPD